MSEHDVTPALTVTMGKGKDPQPYFEAVWNERREGRGWKPAKQRIGRAWVAQDGVDHRGRPVWVKRRGRVPDGYFDERCGSRRCLGLASSRAHAQRAHAASREPDREGARARVARPAAGGAGHQPGSPTAARLVHAPGSPTVDARHGLREAVRVRVALAGCNRLEDLLKPLAFAS